jgi:macrolide-specific efflux system membrane fusion protein
MQKKTIIIWTLIIVAAIGIGYWMVERHLQKEKAAAAGSFQIVQVERKDLSETVDGDGDVVFSKNGGIYPAYSATVQKVNCQAGSKVKKGELLMVLTSDTLKTKWVEAEYNYKKAKLDLSLAQKTLERERALYKIQGTTIDQLDSAQNNVDLDKAALSSAASEFEQLTQTPDYANYMGSDHRTILIRAPFDGQIAWVEVKPGQTVSAIGSNSSDASSNNLLLYLVADNSLEIEATVDETEINNVKPGQRAKVVLNDTAQTELSGTVMQVGAYGTSDSGVIVYPVRIRINDGKIVVRPQMTADVSIYITENPNVLAIPVNAVLDIRGKTMVKKMVGGKPELTEVELGVKNVSYVEVRSGLQDGDQIMVASKETESTTQRSNKQRRNMMGPGGPPM